MNKEQFDKVLKLLNDMSHAVGDIQMAASYNCPCDSDGYEEAEDKLIDFLKGLIKEED